MDVSQVIAVAGANVGTVIVCVAVLWTKVSDIDSRLRRIEISLARCQGAAGCEPGEED
jgi:hypothetical protein